jgi:two-component system sensor histidine kinase DevS
MPLPDLRVPSFRLASILALGLLSALIAITLATRQIRFDYDFALGVILKADTGSMSIEALDLIGEPGEISDDGESRRFFERQDLLSRFLQSPSLIAIKNGQARALTPQAPSISQLPAVFWIQIAVGLGAFLISAWVWCLRPKDKGAGLFFVSGMATLMFTFAAAIYTTRELALPAGIFRPLVAMNEFGASLFGISVLALFTIYPYRFARYRLFIGTQALFFGVWTACAILDIIPAWAGVNLITLMEMLGICVAILAQFRATRGDPKARASLTWLGLSVLIGAGIFIAFNATPLALGQEAALEQAYGFLSFLFIYIGLAAGIYRFRLFEVGRWGYRFLFYVLGAFLLLALDAALILVIGLDRLPALGVSFFVLSLFYLPLRDSIESRIRPGSQLKAHELLEEILHVAFAPTAALRLERWHFLVRKVFDPLELVPMVPAASAVQIENHGLSLILPEVGDIPSLKISYQSSGRSLFSSDSCQLARQIVDLIGQAESSRKAYDRGVFEERRRMAQDLHDDVGARLLTALYQSDATVRPTLEAVLADIREIVSEASDKGMPLAEVLADLRYETSRRLAAARIDLEWPLDLDHPQFHQTLSWREHKTLRSGFRELISNVIRHAEASSVKVALECHDDFLQIQVDDNGKGIPQRVLNGENQGNGIRNLRQRMHALGGSCDWDLSGARSSVLLKIPYGKNCITPQNGG